MPSQNQKSESNLQDEMPQKSTKIWMITSILLGLVLIALSVFGYYKWQQYKKLVGSLGADVNSLNAQIANLNAQLAIISKTSQSTTTQTDAQKIKTVINNYCAAQLDPTTSKSLSFFTGSKTINLSSDKLSATINGQCALTSGTGATTFILKKANDEWMVIYTGDTPPTEIEKQFNLPKSYPIAVTF